MSLQKCYFAKNANIVLDWQTQSKMLALACTLKAEKKYWKLGIDVLGYIMASVFKHWISH